MKQTKIDQTFSLIKSLEKKEVIFFKKFAKLYSKNKEPEYLLLFESMYKMKEYTDSLLKGKKFYKNLNYNKNYLFNQIIKSLRFQHQENSKEKKIRNLIDESEILRQKNLIFLAKKQIRKANNLITKNDSFYLNYEILDYNFSLKQFKNLDEKIKSSKEHGKKSKQILLNELEVLKYHKLSSYVNQINNKFNKENKTTSIKIIKNLLAKNKFLRKYKVNTDHSLALKLYTKGICYTILGKEKKAFKFQRKTFDILLQNKVNKIRPKSFISALTSVLNVLLNLKRYDIFHKYISYLKIVPPGKNFSLIVFERELMFYTRYYLESKQYKKGLKYTTENIEEYKLNEKFFNDRRKAEISYSFGLIYFFNNDFKEASNAFDKIESVSVNKMSFFKDIVLFSKTINILCHIELGNISYTKTCLNKYRNYLKKQSVFPYYEKIFTDGIHNILNSTTKSDLKQAFERLLTNFKQLKSKSKDNEFLEYFNIIEWLRLKTDKNEE